MADHAGLKVQFLFDFGSPNAYLAAKIIPDVEKRTGVRFDYVPALLGGIYKLTGNSSPADYLRGIRNKREYMEVETERFIRRHGITSFRKNPFFPVNTLATDARRGRGTGRRAILAVLPRRLSAHVGGAQEDGRPRGDDGGAQCVRHRRSQNRGEGAGA